MRKGMMLAAMTAAVGISAFASAEDVQLPDKAAAVIKERFAKAKISEVEKEKEDGQEVFEVELTQGKRAIEVCITAEGRVLEVERSLNAKKLPEALAKGLEAKYPGATISEACVVRKKKVTTYEVELTTKDKKEVEAVFDADGKFVEEEKEDDDKDDEKDD